MFCGRFLSVGLCLLSIVVDASASSTKRSDNPDLISVSTRAPGTPPSQDPFYIPPDGFEAAAPGTILRSRPVPNPIAAFISFPLNVKAAYQLLYRTTNSKGVAEATVTTLIVPHNADPSKLLSYQTAEDSAWIDCAPSYSLQYMTNSSDSGGSIEILFIAAALERGWYVNVPDYEGPKGAYVATIGSGRRVLDSIRAALASNSVSSISPSAALSMWGYSGGALASGWAAELAEQYAPELLFAGVALGGTVPNITSIILTINGGTSVGLSVAGINGISKDYPEFSEYLDQHLLPANATKFKQANTQCASADLSEYSNEDLFSYFDTPDFLTDPTVQGVLAQTQMGYNTPKMPLYVYKSVGDELSPIADTDWLISQYCLHGAEVQYVRDLLSNHELLAITGAADAFLWLIDRMAGKPAAPGCSNSTVPSTLLEPTAVLAFGVIIAGDLLDILGKPVGPLL